MATAINDGESVRLTEAGIVYTVEKGGGISIESNGNNIIFYRNGKRFLELAYTAFTTPTFTSAEDGRDQIEAMLSAASGASNPGKAEDSAHVSGDIGNFVLAVRVDPNAAGNPAAALAGTDNDYIPFAVDNLGRLYVAPHALLASEVFIGQTNGVNTSSTVAITRAANTTQYAINDVMNNGADTTPLAFTLARANDLRGWVVGGLCVSGSNQATLPNIDLLLFSSTFTIAADNAAFAPTYAQMQTYLGKIRFSTWVARGVRSDSDGSVEQPFVFIPASGTQIVYGVPVMQNTYTPVSVENLQFSVNAERY